MTARTLDYIQDFAATGVEQNLQSLESSNDIDLAKLAAEGNMEAFEELYSRHYRKVYALCFRMLQNTAEAEDLTQDVFIQLHRKIGSFRGESAFTTWLHRLTINQVLMHFRKRIVKYEKTASDEESQPVQITPGTENHNRMSVFDRIALEEAIAELPEGYRKVFLLHDVEGFEHEEIARILGCSVGTSKSQLHKARAKLKRILTKKANPRLVR
ncbi:MAG: RNA polymerase sigma factor [Pyrinomonadaceae bacterium]|nr:RNA polymerase sigma factor [Pyrinomonadaceae bacterium]MCX7640576.1 RNA polymerase sigma factor [Pyrinomonadaceae bacterium]MDW8303843.1 RNA polymerase sigma factor [Acidobacteriota bacterium]